ncbi:MAG: transposase [Kiritimatiellae bacterium]|nr:transposase [Kiritimatiellia bacterium]
MQFAGAKYHVTVRGNARQNIFLLTEDRERFLLQLEESLDQYGVILFAYTLMSNHYHLLVETPRKNVSRFMQRLNTAYSLYFRVRHQRPGHTFQGRFGAKLVDGDSYLLGVTRYIHLNPVKTKTAEMMTRAERLDQLNKYRWSSYRGYVEKGRSEEFVDYRLRTLIGGRADTQPNRYRAFVTSKLLEDDEVLREAYQASRYAIGDDAFISDVEDRVNKHRKFSTPQDPDVAWPNGRAPEIEQIKHAVALRFRCSVEDMRKRGRAAAAAKSLAVGLSCRLSGLTRRQIGVAFGITGAAVSYQERLMIARAEASQKYAEVMQDITAALGGTSG